MDAIDRLKTLSGIARLRRFNIEEIVSYSGLPVETVMAYAEPFIVELSQQEKETGHYNYGVRYDREASLLDTLKDLYACPEVKPWLREQNPVPVITERLRSILEGTESLMDEMRDEAIPFEPEDISYLRRRFSAVTYAIKNAEKLHGDEHFSAIKDQAVGFKMRLDKLLPA